MSASDHLQPDQYQGEERRQTRRPRPGVAEDLAREAERMKWKAKEGKVPEQLSMFHTPREIMKRWGTVAGDRYWRDPDEETVPIFVHKTPMATLQTMARHGYQPENDQEMWDRKLNEANAAEYPQAHPTEWGMYGHVVRPQSLIEHIQRGGEISPIPLTHESFREQVENEVFQPLETTSAGFETIYGHPDRPLLGGGQHRVAAMAHLNPDQLLPVRHYETWEESHKDPQRVAEEQD